MFPTRRAADLMGGAQAGVDSVGKGEGVNKLAMRFRAQSDQRASVNVESAVPDQIFIDHRVEVAVVLDVIDVPVDVVVLPARTDAREMRVLRSEEHTSELQSLMRI